ncbi:MAG: hypothetical protein KF812_10365, partial [Fimbriimonadaceae bacterium]|nr:hypothetical protein [Fimbriimonadaceae bacterium]
MNRVPLWGVLAGIVAVFVAMVSLGYRYSVEQSNRAVGIMVEMPTVRAFAHAEGVSVAEALARLQSAGATGVALQEQTVRQIMPNTGTQFVVPSNDIDRFERGMRRNGPPIGQVRGVQGEGGFNGTLLDSDDLDLFLNTPIGIDPDEAKLVTNAGLELIARHSNQAGYNAADVRDVLAESKALGATAYLPAGDAVLGYRTAQNATIQALQENNLYYLTTEFSV